MVQDLNGSGFDRIVTATQSTRLSTTKTILSNFMDHIIPKLHDISISILINKNLNNFREMKIKFF